MNEQLNNVSQREVAQQKYAAARGNLILMLALTFVNIILLVAGADIMLLFSATVPYYSVLFGMIMTNLGMSSFMWVGILVAAVILLLYFFCWLFSKKHTGWMIAALVLFGLDTVCLIVLSILFKEVSGILDLAIHGLVLYYLIVGVIQGIRLNRMPKEEVVSVETDGNTAD